MKKSELKQMIREIIVEETVKVGTIIMMHGKRYKKQSNNKWIEVSIDGLSKKEHEQEIKILQKVEENPGNEVNDRRKAQDEQNKHHDEAMKLSNKEYTSDELLTK